MNKSLLKLNAVLFAIGYFLFLFLVSPIMIPVSLVIWIDDPDEFDFKIGQGFRDNLSTIKDRWNGE